MSRRQAPEPEPRKAVRCAIYTRKSTEEGLEQEFNSLDAQRESAEAYVASQRHAGWLALPDRYDDGGYTGGNMDRPALGRLMEDVRARKVDCVVVYKVDRLSRSLLDFARIMGEFERHGVSFVSVTQQFNTASSMGRLVLNVLLSFAQFERELVSERTRDKIALARQKGKYAGGRPVLGYDAVATKLVVNEDEAAVVRDLFSTYLRTESLGRTLEAALARGVRTKRWTTRAGGVQGGAPMTKGRLHALLTNVLYIGHVRHGEKVYKGEHAAIVEEATFERVRALLGENHRTGGSEVMNKHGAVLKGVLRCGACGSRMVHSCVRKPEGRVYRYYVCQTAQTTGRSACGGATVPAGQIEGFVLERLRGLGRDGALVGLILEEARRQGAKDEERADAEMAVAERELRRVAAEVKRVAAAGGDAAALAALDDRSRAAERRVAELRRELDDLRTAAVTRERVRAEAAEFEPLWRTLSPRERARLLRLVVRRVDFDAAGGEVSVTFHPESRWLAEEGACGTA